MRNERRTDQRRRRRVRFDRYVWTCAISGVLLSLSPGLGGAQVPPPSVKPDSPIEAAPPTGTPGQVVQPAPAPQTPSAQTTQSQPSGGVERENAELIMTLVRTSLIALHQANLTGNYTVLRDLGTPAFRERNSPTDLGGIFAWLRQLKVDLSASVRIDPKISRASVSKEKILDVVGQLATKPVGIGFEFVFQPVGGWWRIDAIGITPGQASDSPYQPPASDGGQHTAPSQAKKPVAGTPAPTRKTQLRNKAKPRPGSPPEVDQ